MDKKIYELLKDIDSHSNQIRDWEEITDIFANVIKRNGLNKEEVEEINEKILKEIAKSKKGVNSKVIDREIE
jgi:hypothetical protein